MTKPSPSVPSLQLHRSALISGPVIRVDLAAAGVLGIRLATLLSQVSFLVQRCTKPSNSRRISFRRLHAHLGSGVCSLRWLVEGLKTLESSGLILIHRDGGVNVYSLTDAWIEVLANSNRWVVISPALAEVVGLLPAVVLQQVHQRCSGYDGSYWVGRSVQGWRAMFPFSGPEVLQRAIRNVKSAGLILDHPKERLDGVQLRLRRVEYRELAKVCGFAIDADSGRDKAVSWANKPWVSPLDPVTESGVCAEVSKSKLHEGGQNFSSPP
jgi:hypothetical protein